MDPLSITGGVIAVLQATNSVLTLCYKIREGIRKTPWTFIQIIEETRDLRNIIEAIQLALDEPALSKEENSAQYRAAQDLSDFTKGPLSACLEELLAIESKIQPRSVERCLEYKRKALIHSIGWQLKEGEAMESIARLERCKNSLSLAINSHSSITIRNIQRMTVSLGSKVDDSCIRLKSLAKDFSESRLSDQQRDMVDWLSPLKPWEGHEAACRLHEAGTSEWFINSVEYMEWVGSRDKLLWLSGPPGMGKTTLMSQAIDALATHIDQTSTDKRLSTDPGLVWFPKGLRQLVSSSINSKSNGMFRWAHCQVESLTQARTPKFVKRSLASLPTGLDETYGRALAAVPPYDVPLVQKALAWLAFSIVPITLDQLWEALAIEPGMSFIDEESRLRSPQDILVLSNNLISVTPEGQVVLSHLSVRDYLLSESIKKRVETSKFALKAIESHQMLALDCLTYLLFADLSQGPATTQHEYVSRLEKLPLLTYATKSVFYHLQNMGSDNDLRELSLQFLSPQARPNFMSWVQVLNADSPFKWDVYPRYATPLYYVASFGLCDIAMLLLKAGGVEDLNSAGSRFGGTAVHGAAIRNHTDVIQLLIDAGADPGKADLNKVTPLHSAASRGSVAVVRLLLWHGAPTDVKDAMDGKTPAEWARLSGYDEVAEMIEGNLSGLGLNEPGFVNSETSAIKPESGEVNVWQPGQPCRVLADFYEPRSGLDSSIMLGFEVEGRKVTFDPAFHPSAPLENT